MAKKRFELTEVKKGNNISWFIASQAYYTGSIKLSDESGKVYVDVSQLGNTGFVSLVAHELTNNLK